MVKFDSSKDDTKEIGMVNVYLKDNIIVKFHARDFINKIFRVEIYFDLVSKGTVFRDKDTFLDCVLLNVYCKSTLELVFVRLYVVLQINVDRYGEQNTEIITI